VYLSEGPFGPFAPLVGFGVAQLVVGVLASLPLWTPLALPAAEKKRA
jgi:hypothetical protein